ncbi:MAG: hypothetical protein HFJ54_06635 [Clostridia bacterium]|nr:hypothetical protein [Clostridia bacterium]
MKVVRGSTLIYLIVIITILILLIVLMINVIYEYVMIEFEVNRMEKREEYVDDIRIKYMISTKIYSYREYKRRARNR